MQTLFPVAPVYPPGFDYYPEIISREEELKLLLDIEQLELKTFHFQGYEARRKTASFGYDWSFEKRELSRGSEIPVTFTWLIERVALKLSVDHRQFSELLVTEYPVGAVINWHRDAPPFEMIAGISLSTDCTFKLRPYDKSKQGRQAVISVPVQRRSLYVIKDEARRDWEHSISPVKQTRYSITLRTLKKDLP
jgi:alkylated DNA repair dioxygenase AlkB